MASRVHLPVLAGLPGVRLVAIAESNPQRREAAAALAPNARVLSDHGALLDIPEVDAVVVCLPNDLHAQVAVAALERGMHVYLEKPLATTLEDGRRVVEAWERAGVVGMIGFNQRFNPLYRGLKRKIGEEPLGPWVGARMVLAAPERDLPAWKRRREAGGGALLDQASHHFDLIRYLFDDEIVEVSASLRSQRSEADTAFVHARLTSGLLIQSFVSIHTIDEDRIEVYAENGRISVDRYRAGSLSLSDRLARFRAHGREPSFRHALAHFVESIRTDAPATPNFEDGYRSLVGVLAAEESARSGRTVRLEEMVAGIRAG